MKIYKYPLENCTSAGEYTVEMPREARILSAINQNDQIIIYAMVDPEAIIEQKKFFVFGTGWNITAKALLLSFIGTVQQGPLVWHIFE